MRRLDQESEVGRILFAQRCFPLVEIRHWRSPHCREERREEGGGRREEYDNMVVFLVSAILRHKTLKEQKSKRRGFGPASNVIQYTRVHQAGVQRRLGAFTPGFVTKQK